MSESATLSDNIEFLSLPYEVEVTAVVSSRYSDGIRPEVWEDRIAGIDKVEIKGGKVISLNSDGGQSTPKPGWRILLREVSSDSSYKWTLYGRSR